MCLELILSFEMDALIEMSFSLKFLTKPWKYVSPGLEAVKHAINSMETESYYLIWNTAVPLMVCRPV